MADLPLELPQAQATPQGLLNLYRGSSQFSGGEIEFSPDKQTCVSYFQTSADLGLTIARLGPQAKHSPVWHVEHPSAPTRSAIRSWGFAPTGTLIVDMWSTGDGYYHAAKVDPTSGRLIPDAARRRQATLGFRLAPDLKTVVAYQGNYVFPPAKEPGLVEKADCVLRDFSTGQLIKTLASDIDGIGGPVRFVFSQSGKRVAALIGWRTRVFDTTTGAELPLVDELKFARMWLVDDGRVLVVVRNDDTVEGIDIDTNTAAFAWNAATQQVGALTAISFSPDGKLAICGSRSGELTLRNAQSGDVQMREQVGDKAIGAVGISSDATLIAAADSDRRLKVWSLGKRARPKASVSEVNETIQVESDAPTAVRLPVQLESAASPSKVEIITDIKQFESRLAELRMIDFEDVATPDSDGVVPITEERYAKDGIILRGTDGQFVGQRFGYPDSYRPHSGKNMFAPGPVAGTNGAVGEGGHETAILFSINGKPASVAGFGAHFIDCNGGENGLIAYDSSGKELAKKLDVYGSKAVAMFVGVLAVDSAGQPVPSISKLVLHNGSGWPGVYNNYGVVIDDLLYSVPQVIAVKK